jgi:hypothetical protein
VALDQKRLMSKLAKPCRIPPGEFACDACPTDRNDPEAGRVDVGDLVVMDRETYFQAIEARLVEEKRSGMGSPQALAAFWAIAQPALDRLQAKRDARAKNKDSKPRPAKGKEINMDDVTECECDDPDDCECEAEREDAMPMLPRRMIDSVLDYAPAARADAFGPDTDEEAAKAAMIRRSRGGGR